MGTLIITPTLRREQSPDLFSDITDSEWHVSQNFVNEYEWVFEDDLTTEQVLAIRERCVLSPEKEQIKNDALNAVATLEGFRDFSGTATTAQLTSAVKDVSGILIGVIRVLYDQID